MPGLHPTRSAEIQFWGKPLGEVGEVDPAVLERFEISGRAAWLQLRVPPMIRAMEAAPKSRPVSRYPASDLDLAFVVGNEVSAADVAVTIKKAGGAEVESVELFDVFRSDSLASGDDNGSASGTVRSLAYRVRLRALDRTLTDAEVTELRQKIVGAAAKHHHATLR